MKRIIAAALSLTLVLTMAACGKKAEETTTTTVTGMVTAVNGTVISLVEMDGNLSGGQQPGGQRPSRPENMEGFENFEGFEGFEEGQMPNFEGGERPTFPEGQMPDFEGGERPQMPTG